MYIPTFSETYGEPSNELSIFRFDNSLHYKGELSWSGGAADYGYAVDTYYLSGSEILVVAGESYSFSGASGRGIVLYNSEMPNIEAKAPKKEDPSSESVANSWNMEIITVIASSCVLICIYACITPNIKRFKRI